MTNVLYRMKNISSFMTRNVISKFYSTKIKKRPIPVGKKIHASCESLASRGFLRSQKPYDPPSDVSDRLRNIFLNAGASSKHGALLDNPATRFNILSNCFKEFGHGVPNSMLNTIESLDDVTAFYSTAVNVTVPLDALKTMELPENLHVQHQYHRFHPESDTMFKGISAFPKSSTLVTSIKYRSKYAGYKAKRSWP